MSLHTFPPSINDSSTSATTAAFSSDSIFHTDIISFNGPICGNFSACYNQSSSENTTIEEGTFPNYSKTPQGKSLLAFMTRSLTIVIAAACVLSNSIVLWATSRTPASVLKSKSFVQNSLVADMALSVGASLHLLASIIKGFSVAPAIHLTIVEIGTSVSAYCIYVQVLSSALLVVDRFYAVIKPLTYHTVGYTMLMKVSLALQPWIWALVLILPAFVIPFVDRRCFEGPIYERLSCGTTLSTQVTRQYVAVIGNLGIFAMYIGVFVVIRIQRRRNRAVIETSTDREKNTLSLTLTYCLIHISNLCFYLPAPIFFVIRQSIPPSVLSRATLTIINRSLVNIYVFNSLVNSFILASRIRLIRQNIHIIVKMDITKPSPRVTDATDDRAKTGRQKC